MPHAWRRPPILLSAFCLLQTVVWTLSPTLTHDAPPLDVVESMMWGREWVWATYKHPSFPGWVLEAGRWLTGTVGWPAYLTSQLFVVATFGLVYRLGLDLFAGRDDAAPRALAGVLLLAGVFYFGWPTPEFNHNVAQLPLFAAIALLCWRATTDGRLRWWLLLGLAMGLGMHMKYTSAIGSVVAALWVMFDGPPLRRLAGVGPWLALATALLVAAPQAVWLVRSDFLPLVYATSRSALTLQDNPAHTLAGYLAAHAGLLGLALAAGLTGQGAAAPLARPEARVQRFLITFALGPVALMLAGTAAFRIGTHDMWASPMADLSGLLAVALYGGRLNPARLRALAAAAACLTAVLAGVYGFAVDHAPMATGRLMRTAWPQRQIADRLHTIWSDATHAPLGIVAGDGWIGGLVGLTAPGHPSILTNGDLQLAPWVTADRLAREGALIVWTDGEARPVSALAQGPITQGTETFEMPGLPELKPVRVHYAILPPAPRASG